MLASVMVVVGVACSGDDATDDGEAVPTLLTIAPIDLSGSTVAEPDAGPPATSGDDGGPRGSGSATQGSSTANSSTARSSPGESAGGSSSASSPTSLGASSASNPSAASATTRPSSGSATSTTAADATGGGTTPPSSSTSTSSTAVVVTSPFPPATLGGTEDDFVAAPAALAGIPFGTPKADVLARLEPLIGAPLGDRQFTTCPGTSTLEWRGVTAVVSEQGLVFYIVGWTTELYGAAGPVPPWHTAGGLRIGATVTDLDALYGNQVAITPGGSGSLFDVTAGPDTGLNGAVESDHVKSVSAGQIACSGAA